jgi:cation diffusion facilitator CzcD-associated flavoprotein CzcO
MDEAANAEMSDYVANRIRQRVADPETAERLIPKDHGYGLQRVPLETRYFEAYNRDNVELVDISATPIEEVTAAGIRTSAASYELDVIVFATGFDAITGAFSQVDVVGVDGQKLNDKWAEDPITYLGVMTHGFPNLLMVGGPQSVSGSNNFPRGLETAVDWVTDLVKHARHNAVTRMESQAEAEQEWLAEVKATYAALLLRKGKGWFTGHNGNIVGRDQDKIRHHMYFGGGPRYAELIRDVAAAGYQRIDMVGEVGTAASAASASQAVT